MVAASIATNTTMAAQRAIPFAMNNVADKSDVVEASMSVAIPPASDIKTAAMNNAPIPTPVAELRTKNRGKSNGAVR